MTNLDFDAAIDAVVNGSATRAAVAPTGSPERAAKSIDLSNRSGIPAPVIDLDPERAQQQIDLSQRADTVRRSPILQAYINSDPMNAKVSSDDLGALDRAWQTVKTLNPIFSILPEPRNLAEALFVGPQENDPVLQREITQNERDAIKRIREGNAGFVDYLAFLQYFPRHALLRTAESINRAVTTLYRAQQDLTNWDQIAEGANFAGLLELGAIPLKPRVRFPAEVTYEVVGSKKIPEPGTPEAAVQTMITLAENQAAGLDAAIQAVIETKTRERAPTKMSEFLRNGVGDETVGVNAEALMKVYDEMGVAPGAGDPVFGFDPDISRKIQTAIATNTDVEVSLADYLARVDPAVHEKLLPNVRSREGLTIEEAKSLQEEIAETMEGKKEGDMGVFPRNEAISADNITLTQSGETVDPDVITTYFNINSGESIIANIGIAQHASNPNRLEIVSIYGPEGDPTKLGPSVVRAALRAVREKYPEASSVFGDRISGAKVQGGRPGDFVWTEVKLPPLKNTVEEGIETSYRSLFLEPLFHDPESAGMTKPEFTLYSKKLEDLQDKARELDLRRLERQTTRELTAEWRTTYAEELAKAQAEFDARRDVVAARFIRSGALERGTATGQAVPLDITAAPDLPKGMAVRGGVHPDEIAGLLGYQTGAELVADVKRLVDEQGRKSEDGFRKAITEALATERARERFGDFTDRAEAIIDMVASPDASRILFDDLRVMQKQGAGDPLNKAELEAWAEREFNSLPMKEARRVNKWIQAVTKNGRKAEMALLRGKLPDAFRAKGEQWISLLFLQQALKFNKQLVKDLRLVKQFSKKTPPKSVDTAFNGQIHRILAGLGVPVRANIPTDLPPLSEFVAEWTELGYSPGVAASLYDPFFYTTPLAQKSVREFREVMLSVQSLKHVGQEAKRVERAGQKQELATAVQDIERNLVQLPFRQQTNDSVREFMRTQAFRIDSYLVKMEEVFDDLDLGNPHGPFNELVYTPLRRGEYFEDELRVDSQKRLGHLRISKPRERLPNTEFLNPMVGTIGKRLPYRVTRADLVMWALNFGNAHTRRLLVDTLVPVPKTNTTPSPEFLAIDRQAAQDQVLNYINRHMREEDWKFVEGLWDYFDHLKPMVDALYLRTSGVAPDTVQPLSFETPFGTKRGGYMRVISDPVRSKVSVLKEAHTFDASYHKATTPNSYTKPRHIGSNEPLLVLGAYQQLAFTIRSMIHDIAMREPLLNANKILYNKEVRELVARHYGQEYVDQFHSWLRYIANHFNEEDRALKWLTGPMRFARINMSIVALGFNLKTILTPNVGPMLLELGWSPTDVAYYSKPENWHRMEQFALESSGELRSRKINMDNNISDAVRSVVGMATPYQRWQAKAAEFGMALVGTIDRKLATFTWIGTYDRATAKGRTHEQAVIEADKAVSKGFGSASPINLAALYRKGEFVKLITQFQQYYNMIYNRNRSTVREITTPTPGGADSVELIEKGAYAGAKRDWPKIMADSFAWFLTPSILGILYIADQLPIGDDNEGDWDDWGAFFGKMIAAQLAAPIPFIRDVAAQLISDLPPSQTPPVRIATSLFRSVEDIWDWSAGDDVSERWLKHAADNVGYLLAAPTGSLGNSAQWMWNVSQGEDELEDFWDFFNGMVYGKSEIRK